MGHAQLERIDRWLRLLPMHQVQERSIFGGVAPLDNSGKRMAGREADERNLEAASARKRQSGRKQRPKYGRFIILDGDVREVGLTKW